MPGRLIRGVARTAVVAGTASAVAGRVNRHQQNKWAAQDQAAQAPAGYPPPQQAYAPPPQQAYAPPPQPVYASPPPVYADPPAAEAAAPDMDEKLAQLKQLGELKDAGVLTDAEFEAQKSRILYA
jgi:hypothetical protein